MNKPKLTKDVRVRISFELERLIDDIARMNDIKPATLTRLILLENVKNYIPDRFKRSFNSFDNKKHH